MKKYSFQKLVNHKIGDATIELNIRDDPSRSESKRIDPYDQMKDYLKSNDQTTKEKQLCFI
jgi:hypothetical protein